MNGLQNIRKGALPPVRPRCNKADLSVAVGVNRFSERALISCRLDVGAGKPVAKFLQCLCAVTQLVFFSSTQFGKRTFKAIRHKERIVAKTVLAGRRKTDLPLARAFEEFSY